MENRILNVIVGCEESQEVAKAFRKLGHNAISVDLLPCSGGMPEHHIQGDIFEVLGRYPEGYFDIGIFHPPCTFLSNSGVRWLYNKDGTNNEERWANMREGAQFFKELLNQKIKHIGLENPIIHRYAREIIGEKFTQSIQPWEFGHTTTKRTCLWLKNLPNLVPTKIIPKEQRTSEIWLCPPGPDRQKIRSKTFSGIAEAIAVQWSKYVLENEQTTEGSGN